MECSPRKSLWYEPFRYLSNQRGKNSSSGACLIFPLAWQEVKLIILISFSQYRMTYNLYIAAFAGAGITILALVSVEGQFEVWPFLWLMWQSDAQSVGSEASQASMTDDSCTIALCSSLSADTGSIQAAVMSGGGPARHAAIILSCSITEAVISTSNY